MKADVGYVGSGFSRIFDPGFSSREVDPTPGRIHQSGSTPHASRTHVPIRRKAESHARVEELQRSLEERSATRIAGKALLLQFRRCIIVERVLGSASWKGSMGRTSTVSDRFRAGTPLASSPRHEEEASMAMVHALDLVTAEELLRMPDDGHWYELVDGRLIEMPPPAWPHGVVSMRIGGLLHAFVETHRLGLVFARDTGFRLSSDPDTVRAPDVAFVARDRMTAGVPGHGYWPGAPDLAVEVMSPGDRFCALEDKVRQYLAAGTRVAWIVSPAERMVRVYEPGRPAVTCGASDVIEGGDVVPGFHCEVAPLFADLGPAREQGPVQKQGCHHGCRGARPAGREQRAYRAYVSDEPRSPVGSIGSQDGTCVPGRLQRHQRGRRCIPRSGVVRRLPAPGMGTPRALPRGRLDAHDGHSFLSGSLPEN
jgi:Uma2 family endonuclease